MDLSGMIFVALAVGWAAYLLPKVLRHHDEIARDRTVETFSSRVRVLTRRPAAVEHSSHTTTIRRTAMGQAAETPTARAARRRRRVLAVLLGALVVVVVLAALGVLPWWSVAVPVAAILAFLVTARVSVRRQQMTRFTASLEDYRSTPRTGIVTLEQATTEVAAEVLDDTEETVGVPMEDVAAALAQSPAPAADSAETAGALWDPLPMTLPTYVTKPAARRTVRTIELTGSLTSSGHDEADSALVRESETSAAAEAEGRDDQGGADDQRRAAGA